MKNKILFVGLLCSLLALTSCDIFGNKIKPDNNFDSNNSNASSENLPEPDFNLLPEDQYNKIVSLTHNSKNYKGDLSYSKSYQSSTYNEIRKNNELVKDDYLYQKYFNKDYNENYSSEFMDFEQYNYDSNKLDLIYKKDHISSDFSYNILAHDYVQNEQLIETNITNSFGIKDCYKNVYNPTYLDEIRQTPYTFQYWSNSDYYLPLIDTRLSYSDYLKETKAHYTTLGDLDPHRIDIQTHVDKSKDKYSFSFKFSYPSNVGEYFINYTCTYNNTQILSHECSMKLIYHFKYNDIDCYKHVSNMFYIDYAYKVDSEISLNNEELELEKNAKDSDSNYLGFMLYYKNFEGESKSYPVLQIIDNQSLYDALIETRELYKNYDLKFYEDYDCTIPFNDKKEIKIDDIKQLFLKYEPKDGYALVKYTRYNLAFNENVTALEIVELSTIRYLTVNEVIAKSYPKIHKIVLNGKILSDNDYLNMANNKKNILYIYYDTSFTL